MRILSQDGNSDYPYDDIGLSIGWQRDKSKYYIFCHHKLQDGGIKIAEYSTEEKAKKAMEMLHEAYTGTFFAQNLELPEGGIDDLKQLMKHGYGCVTVMKDNSDVRFEPLNICFQFPRDEEIEI